MNPQQQPPQQQYTGYQGGQQQYSQQQHASPTPDASVPYMQPGQQAAALHTPATLTGKPPKAHASLYILAIVVVAGVLGGLMGAAAYAAFDDSVDGERTLRLKERDTDPGSVGDTMIDQRAAFTVESFECGVRIPDINTRRDYQLCVAQIVMESRDSEGYRPTSAREKLFTQSGDQHRDSSHMGIKYRMDALGESEGKARSSNRGSTELTEGESITVYRVYEIPRGATPEYLELNDISYENESVRVNLS